MTNVDSRVQAARDLRALANVEDALRTQAVAKAGDTLMPGGLAMVALAGSANQERWAHQVDAAEVHAIVLAEAFGLEAGDLMPEIEDNDWEPPLQTLCFWSEQWRAERGQEFEPNLDGPTRSVSAPTRPTITTEANFLRGSLDWAWENELRWDDFVKDLAKARSRVETVLVQGARPVARGVSCMYDECKGARLIRTTVPASDAEGNKVWRLTDWHCPKCKRSWDEERYAAMVFAAIHREKTFVVEGEVWCTVEVAAKKVERPEATVRVWLHREQVAEICVLGRRRWRYVLLSDVEARDRLARERWAKRLAARRIKTGVSS